MSQSRKEDSSKSSINKDDCGKCHKPCKRSQKAMDCDICQTWFHVTCTDVEEDEYDVYVKKQQAKRGFKWFCPECRAIVSDTLSSLKAGSGNKVMLGELEKMQQKFDKDFEKINSQIKSLTSNLQRLDSTHKNFEKTSEDLTTAITGAKKFSDLFKNTPNTDNGDIITNIAKKAIDDHKRIEEDRKAREKNIIIFNGPQEKPDESDHDYCFFKDLCVNILEVTDIEEVKITRIGLKTNTKTRPIKVNFSQSWDKRKFLTKLSNLKTQAKYEGLRVAHDMSMEDRLQNKTLLRQAYERNQREQPNGFKYKVRGPPYNMRIEKIFAKNGGNQIPVHK